MADSDDAELLRRVALQNARSILLARGGAEEELRKQSDWLRVTLSSIGDAVISTDAEGRVIFMNGVAESLTGWCQSDAVGRPLSDVFQIINEQTRRPVENPAHRALRERAIVGLANHTILIAKDGVERPIDDSAAPIKDEHGSVVGVVLVFRDISERKREEAARAERTRLIALRADINTALVSAMATPAALHECCDAFTRHLTAAFARIWTLNETDNVLELQASAGMYTHLDGPHSRVPVGEFKIGRIASSGQPHLTNAVVDDPNVSDPRWAAREGMVAFAGYPLAVDGRVVGVVAMFARNPLTENVLTEPGAASRYDRTVHCSPASGGPDTRASRAIACHAGQHWRCRDYHRHAWSGRLPQCRGGVPDRLEAGTRGRRTAGDGVSDRQREYSRAGRKPCGQGA